MTAKAGDNGQWTITTLDDEEQTVTIAVHNKEKSDTILVEGTFMDSLKQVEHCITLVESLQF